MCSPPLPRHRARLEGARRRVKHRNDNVLERSTAARGVVPGRSCRGVSMARARKVRVPNPAKPSKGRLDAPPEKVHRPKTRYRRRPKHPGSEERD